MNKKPLIWLTKQVKRRIPGLAVLTASQMGYSLLCVFFAPASKGTGGSGWENPYGEKRNMNQRTGLTCPLLFCTN